jgi:hypothetical protein
MHSALYDLFRDQGSIVAGVLALVAGILAYRGARQAAEMQVSALNAQTEAVRQQNTELKNENRRKLAREGIISIRLLGGVLSRVTEDISRLDKLLDQPQFFKPDATVPADWRKLIYKPPLATIWDNLAVCGTEVINNYLLLDAKVEEFINREINGVHYIKNELAKFTNIVNFLDDELRRDATRCNAVLSEISEMTIPAGRQTRPDTMRLEDDDKARDEIQKLQQTALDHAWSWWKYHAEQRIALIRFYIIALGGVAVAVGWAYQREEYLLCFIISVFGALLSYCFVQLDARTSDLVKVGENALAPEQERMAAATDNEAMRLCRSADVQQGRFPYSYRKIMYVVLGTAAALFIIMGVVSLCFFSPPLIRLLSAAPSQ